MKKSRVRKSPTAYLPSDAKAWGPESQGNTDHTDAHYEPPCEFDKYVERNHQWDGCIPLDITNEALEATITIFGVARKKGIF